MIQIDFEALIFEIFRRVFMKDRLSFFLEAAEQHTTAIVVSHVDMTIVVVNDGRIRRYAERLEYCVVMLARVHRYFNARIAQLA